MSAISELIVHRTREASRSIPCSSLVTKREPTRHRKASSSSRAAQILRQGPLRSTLRANPFPKVTDLLCPLPSPILFCGPEAANLGDLMRLWVRSGVQKNLSFCFSRAVGSASGTANDKVLCEPINPIARQSDFRVKSCKKEKTTLPEAYTCIAEFLYVTVHQPINPVGRQSDFSEKVVQKKRQRFPKLPLALPNSFESVKVIHVLVGEYQPHSPYEAKPVCAEHFCLLRSTNPCPTAVHMGLSRPKRRRVSFEYQLLLRLSVSPLLPFFTRVYVCSKSS